MVQHLRALERVASARVTEKPDRAEVEGAVRTMIRWAGDDPDATACAKRPPRRARLRGILLGLCAGPEPRS